MITFSLGFSPVCILWFSLVCIMLHVDPMDRIERYMIKVGCLRLLPCSSTFTMYLYFYHVPK